MTLILTILLLLTIRPSDGGNHPRKDGVAQPVNEAYKFNQPQHGHPPKEWWYEC